MSIIDLIDNKDVWLEFLEHKKSSGHLPLKVIKNYENFILNEEYKSLAKKIKEEKYTFSIPKKTLIGKLGKSKKRVVYLYNKEETYILKLISYLLYKYDYLFSNNLFSFRKESGVKKAIQMLIKNKNIKNMYAYKVDISNYFNSIPIKNLLNDLDEEIKDEKLLNLFHQILENDKVSYEDVIISEQKGIMAGIPISAFLANFYLKDMDKKFALKNIIYLRYADDIIVFGNTYEDVLNYSDEIKNYLSIRGLTVNNDKEFYYNPKDKIEFLGFSYQDGIIDVSDNSFKKMKGKIKRSAKGIRRWMLRKNASSEATLKAINRKFNCKFYGKNENDLTWKYWFFPIINTTKTLKEIDLYMQQEQRFLVTGVHNKKNYEKVPYELLKKCNYKPLVHEYYEFKNGGKNGSLF